MPTTIKLGDTGDDVKRLQRVFARMKVLAPDDLDGIFGPRTEDAVKDFQESNGLVVDGVVGPITWSHVHPYREASPTLQAGSLGPVVAMLQAVLKTGFGYTGAIDGIFGPATEAVLRQYQTDSALPVTEVSGRADLDGARRCRRRNAREPLGSDPLTAARRARAAPTRRLRRAARLKSGFEQRLTVRCRLPLSVVCNALAKS